MRVGVVGVGTVGAAVADNLERYNEVARWDPDKGYRDAIRGSDIIFICVYDTGNMELVTSVVQQYASLGAPLVIKTTLRPGTTDDLEERFGAEMAFCPEFLSADTAHEDFEHQGYAVIGTRSTRALALLRELLTPFASRFLVMEPVQAEILKLAQNAFYAIKVIFANEIADICEVWGNDYEPVRDALYMSPFIGHNHLDVDHKGYRGFGGACLPKDTTMLSWEGSRLAELALSINKVLEC